MREYFIIIYSAVFLLFSLFVFAEKEVKNDYNYTTLKQRIYQKYSQIKPNIFSIKPSGVKTYLKTDQKIIAFTFDACDGKFDKNLIDFLIAHRIPATLFISGRWIDSNLDAFIELSENPLFDIANHGLNHKPCTVKGFCKHNIKGTKNVNEVVDEIELNARKIDAITGRRPLFYRSGTAYYDDVAVKISYELDQIPVNFCIVPGDADKKISAQRIASNILKSVKAGSIIIMHMNHPERNTRKGIEQVIPLLKKSGYSFVKLKEYIHLLE